MNCPLAVLAPEVGVTVATFIRRHACDLLPGGTAVVARASFPEAVQTDWKVEGPVLDLARIIGGRLRWQLAHAVGKQFGLRLDRVVVKRFLRAHRVQVVLGEYLDFSIEWFDIARELGLPFFVHCHGDDVTVRLREQNWRSRYLRYNAAAGIIANSRACRDELLAAGLQPAKVRVVHYGVDVPPAPPARPQRPQIRCIAVGRVVPEKAPILSLDAFRRALEVCPSMRLDLVGAGPLLPAVEEFIRAFHLEHAVTLHGGQPNAVVQRLLEGSDLFIQHSLREGLGVSILEAMTQALPVVATRTGGIPETVLDCFTGYLVDPGDSAGMAKRIVTLARNPDLRHQMGLAGWQRAKECFTWERERAELLRILGLENLACAAYPINH